MDFRKQVRTSQKLLLQGKERGQREPWWGEFTEVALLGEESLE